MASKLLILRLVQALVLGCVFTSGGAAAQNCAPGIPQGGNPACIPPNAPGSPYYDPPAPRPLPPPVPSGEWESRYGSIVADYANARVGVSVRQPSEEAAQRAALADCQSLGGQNCELVMTYFNQCVAMAWPVQGGTAYTVRESTRQKAERWALEKCAAEGKGCEMSYSECSLPVFHPR
ncbi:DUF4189 domain-containing protein [Lysobacter xanthus]